MISFSQHCQRISLTSWKFCDLTQRLCLQVCLKFAIASVAAQSIYIRTSTRLILANTFENHKSASKNPCNIISTLHFKCAESNVYFLAYNISQKCCSFILLNIVCVRYIILPKRKGLSGRLFFVLHFSWFFSFLSLFDHSEISKSDGW